MKHIALILLVLFASCEKTTVDPSNTKSKKQIETPSDERRGGNGNGNGNGNNTNPCEWTSQYTNASAPQENWGITVDTTVCGFVILRWPAQSNFTPIDSCTAAGAYYIATIPIGSTPTNSCSGNLTYSNAYYYQLGSGCSMWPGREYAIVVSYLERDTISKVLRWHYSERVQFKTGTRATFLGTCQ